jgi:Protein of unknown function (DUF1559)
MKTLRYGLTVVVCSLGLAATARPAPAPKEKSEPPGPITEEQLNESKKNLQLIALAFHNYHDTNGFLPTNELSKDKKPLLSWRVQILPFIEQADLYKQFKLDEPWDSENNKKLIDQMPKIYAPVRGKADAGMTFYQGFSGTNGVIKSGARLPASFPDGTSNTLLVAEAAKPVIWTKPEDMPFDGKELPKLGGLFDGKFHAAMGDGSVHRFKKGIDAELLKRLIDPADGNVINLRAAVDDEEKKD